MWDLPRPGLEPVSPALAGRFLTTAPPGKPLQVCFLTSTSNSATSSCTPTPGNYWLVFCPKILPSIGFHINGIIFFRVWLLSLCIDFEIHQCCFYYWHFNYFLLLSSIPWYEYTTICSSIHQLRFIWVTSTFWLLWIMLLWTFIFRLLCGHSFHLPW